MATLYELPAGSGTTRIPAAAARIPLRRAGWPAGWPAAAGELQLVGRLAAQLAAEWHAAAALYRPATAPPPQHRRPWPQDRPQQLARLLRNGVI